MEIANENRDKSASVADDGLRRLTLRPVGPKKALETFQCAMDIILYFVKGQSALVYLEDVFINSKYPDLQMHHVLQVLALWSDSGNLKKCDLLMICVYEPSHIIKTWRL